MRQRSKTISGAVLLWVLVLTGCGSNSPATAKVPTIAFKSAAIGKSVIPARYTCDGQNVSPPLEWGAVPAGVGNLAVYILGFTPEPATKTYKVSVEWAVAGLNPALHGLAAGRLPPGAYLGVTPDRRQRYSICPKKGTSVQYQFELYGVPSSLAVPRHFPGIPVLRALATSGPTRTDAHGVFVAIYSRK
jgi:phosphatidylethanolamine-binding protein (PEBP) family uncharacterized protein